MDNYRKEGRRGPPINRNRLQQVNVGFRPANLSYLDDLSESSGRPRAQILNELVERARIEAGGTWRET